MSSKHQIRVTIPKWIADIKGWTPKSNLQFVPVTAVNNKPITRDTIFTIKEVEE